MVSASTPLPSSVCGDGLAGGHQRLQPVGVEARIGAQRRGVEKSATSMSTGPSVRVCRMNLPSNFSEVPSSTVSTQASASSRATGSG